MKVGIVGASGELGIEVLEALEQRVDSLAEVVALVRSPAKISNWAARGLEVRPADYDDRESMERSFAGLNRVLLIPSKAPPATRVVQYDNAVGAARHANVPHLLHFGIVGTALDSASSLMPFLLYAESALRTSGLAWTILRNGLYSDPIVDWVPDIARMGTIPYPTRDGRCAYVSRRDIAAAAAGALITDGHEGRVYSLTGPAALTTAELCRSVASFTGQPVEDRGATDEEYLAVCRESGESEFIARVLLSLYHAIAADALSVQTNDVAALAGRPAETFDDHLRRRWPDGVPS